MRYAQFTPRRTHSAFTLLELLLVIAIIASLAGIILMALNPAQRLEEANEVKSLANAKDIEKALNAYVVENEGQYPTALQTKFKNGETRVDVCVSGQVCNGVDLTTGLISEGYLSSIPVHSSYGTSTDSGYDIVYDASTEAIRIIESPVFLLRDDFTTAASAPLTSPRTAEPGPGTFTLTQLSGSPAISAGKISWSSAGFSQAGFYSTGLARKTGRSMILTHNSPSGGTVMAWSKTPTTGFSGFSQVDAGFYIFGDGRTIDNGVDITGSDMTVDNQPLIAILRSTGSFLIGNDNTNWILHMVGASSSTSTLYPSVGSGTNSGISIDNFRVFDLPAPFNTDYGLATDRKTGNVGLGTTFNHEADFLMEFTASTIPTGVNAVWIRFRTYDANNYWFLRIGSDGTLNLYERNAGSSIIKASSAVSAVSTGNRIVMIAEGQTIRGYSNNVLLWTFANATNFTTGTIGAVQVLSDGVVSDIVTWPRTLSGEAAEILNNASL